MLTAIAQGLWHAQAPHQFLGLQLGTRMTVVRLADGGLVLHSPVPLTLDLKAEVAALGAVRHIVAPNLFHHLFAGHWHAAFPEAKLYAPRGLAKKRADLRIDAELDGLAEAPWAGTLEHLHVAGTMLNETVLWHPAAKTLITCDVIINLGRPDHWWTALYLRTMGCYGCTGITRAERWMHKDKAKARAAIDGVIAWHPERILMAHGEAIEEGAVDKLKAAYMWLKP